MKELCNYLLKQLTYDTDADIYIYKIIVAVIF